MRTFDAIELTVEYPDAMVHGKCDQCGRGATLDEIDQYGTLDMVELVGLIPDSYGGTAGELAGVKLGFICRHCYEASKERRFVVFEVGGDVLTEAESLEQAMSQVAECLLEPLEFGKYAPFRVVAQRDYQDAEIIATIDMPAADKAASRAKAGY